MPAAAPRDPGLAPFVQTVLRQTEDTLVAETAFTHEQASIGAEAKPGHLRPSASLVWEALAEAAERLSGRRVSAAAHLADFGPMLLRHDETRMLTLVAERASPTLVVARALDTRARP